MDTVVWILMLLTAFNFLLKLTFWKRKAVWGGAVGMAGFVLLTWPYAIEQSKTQIADWLADPSLMLNVSVVITVEVALQMAFCLLSVHVANVSPVKKRMQMAWRFLYWFPGMLIFPVSFYALTQLIFAWPGLPFQRVAWIFAAGIVAFTIAGSRFLKSVLPERELRLELLFLLNALVAVLGIVATVNGRTAVEGSAAINAGALLGCVGLTLAGAFTGLILFRRKVFQKNN